MGQLRHGVGAGCQPTAAPLRKAWLATERTPGSLKVDRGMLSAVLYPQLSNSNVLASPGPAAEIRSKGFNAVLATSLQRADAADVQASSSAERDLTVTLTLDSLLFVVTVALALLVRVWVSRSLSKLAEQARQVSEGELPDVEVGGPREVRTVARALAEAVATLRGVQAQAAAVADGDLKSEALKTVLPGSLGRVVQASVARAFDAINEREVAQRELAHQAAHDPLTDLPNRGYAVSLISRSLLRQRFARQSPEFGRIVVPEQAGEGHAKESVPIRDEGRGIHEDAAIDGRYLMASATDCRLIMTSFSVRAEWATNSQVSGLFLMSGVPRAAFCRSRGLDPRVGSVSLTPRQGAPTGRRCTASWSVSCPRRTRAGEKSANPSRRRSRNKPRRAAL